MIDLKDRLPSPDPHAVVMGHAGTLAAGTLCLVCRKEIPVDQAHFVRQDGGGSIHVSCGREYDRMCGLKR